MATHDMDMLNKYCSLWSHWFIPCNANNMPLKMYLFRFCSYKTIIQMIPSKVYEGYVNKSNIKFSFFTQFFPIRSENPKPIVSESISVSGKVWPLICKNRRVLQLYCLWNNQSSDTTYVYSEKQREKKMECEGI